MKKKDPPANRDHPADPLYLQTHRERIATHCVCCRSTELKSTPAVLMPFIADRAFGWKPIEIDARWGLQTIKPGMAYSICNSLYCIECGFVFLDIRFSDLELGNIYNGYREEKYTTLRDSYEPGYKLRNSILNSGIDYTREVESFLNSYLNFPISILDWGGDTGKNTPYKSKNTVFDIFDISNKIVIEGARRVNKVTALSSHYDLVVCSNVLEHVPYPADILLDIKVAMNEKSTLYIEVPFESIMQSESPDAYLDKKHWHEHINFYSEKSLSKLTESAGLKCIATNKINILSEGKSACLLQIACKIA